MSKTTKTRTEMTEQEYELDWALNSAKNSLQRVANLFKDYAAKIESRIGDLDEEETNGVRKADYVNWAINDVENCVRNINFNSLARAQAEVAVAGRVHRDSQKK